jgi:hypothetical protein
MVVPKIPKKQHAHILSDRLGVYSPLMTVSTHSPCWNDADNAVSRDSHHCSLIFVNEGASSQGILEYISRHISCTFFGKKMAPFTDSVYIKLEYGSLPPQTRWAIISKKR